MASRTRAQRRRARKAVRVVERPSDAGKPPAVALIQGDARSLPFPDETFACCICSPPYYCKVHYGDDRREIGWAADVEIYVRELVGVYREVRRVLREDGTLFIVLDDTRAKDGRLLRVPLPSLAFTRDAAKLDAAAQDSLHYTI